MEGVSCYIESIGTFVAMAHTQLVDSKLQL